MNPLANNTMRKVTRQEYLLQPNRYELRRGAVEDAPNCPYGNKYQWIGFDKETERYARFTKSVFKLLVNKELGSAPKPF